MQQNQKGHTGLDGPEGPRKHGCEASLAGNPGSARLGGQPKAARPEGSVGYGDTRSISGTHSTIYSKTSKNRFF